MSRRLRELLNSMTRRRRNRVAPQPDLGAEAAMPDYLGFANPRDESPPRMPMASVMTPRDPSPQRMTYDETDREDYLPPLAHPDEEIELNSRMYDSESGRVINFTEEQLREKRRMRDEARQRAMMGDEQRRNYVDRIQTHISEDPDEARDIYANYLKNFPRSRRSMQRVIENNNQYAAIHGTQPGKWGGRSRKRRASKRRRYR